MASLHKKIRKIPDQYDTRSQVFQKIAKEFKIAFSVVEEIQEECIFGTLHFWNNPVREKLEYEFGIEFPFNLSTADRYQTIGDIVDYVSDKLVEKYKAQKEGEAYGRTV